MPTKVTTKKARKNVPTSTQKTKKAAIKKKAAGGKVVKKKALKKKPAGKSKAVQKKVVQKKAVAKRKPAKKKPTQKKRLPLTIPAKDQTVMPGPQPVGIPSVEEPAATEEAIGVITHYYSHLGVAVVQLNKGTLKSDNMIHIKGNVTDFVQKIESMQYEHQHVDLAFAGQSVGLKTIDHVREHDIVYLVK